MGNNIKFNEIAGEKIDNSFRDIIDSNFGDEIGGFHGDETGIFHDAENNTHLVMAAEVLGPRVTATWQVSDEPPHQIMPITIPT